MTLIIFISLFLIGLVVGSFLNVATLRYDPDKGFSNLLSLGGRSRCPICRKQLAWYELVPVLSFLLLRGTCRHCGHRISLQYPIVELLTALIFTTVPLQVGVLLRALFLIDPTALFVAQVVLSALWVAVFVLFLVLAVIDFRHMIIPDAVTVALALFGVVIAGVANWFGGFGAVQGSFLGHYALLFGLRDSIWINHIVAAVVGLAFFGTIIVASRGRAMGLGDVKLAAALGLIFGWPDVVLVFMFSFIVGSVISIGLMMRGAKHMKDAVPFGPFLVIGAAAVFFFGYRAMSLYFGLFGVV